MSIESVKIWVCRVDSRKALKLFSKENFSSISDLDIEYTKLNVGQVVDNMTRESCIPTDSMKDHDDYPKSCA